MKKVSNIFQLFLVLLLLVPMFIEPVLVLAAKKEADSIADLKEELKDLQAEKKAAASEKSQTQSQINSKKQAVADAYQEQEDIKVKVVEAEEKIVASNLEIEETTKETQEVMRFMQISDGENSYLEFIYGAETITDLIMRVSIVEQVTAYNEEVVTKLEDLVAQNEQLKIDLAARNEELEVLKVKYEQNIKSLGSKLSELSEINEDIDSQIKNQKLLIEYYQGVCKSETQSLSECEELAYSTGFIRPTVSGRVSSSFGYRKDPFSGKLSFHNAIDIAGNKEGTPVYAAASGMVAAITKKSKCGGNIIYIHHNVKGKYYTTSYAHLLSYSVKVGDKVTAKTQIGTVGGGKGTRSYDKCSTGAHLHFVVATGRYLGAGVDSYSKWSKFLSHCVDPLNYIPPGKKWTKRY